MLSYCSSESKQIKCFSRFVHFSAHNITCKICSREFRSQIFTKTTLICNSEAWNNLWPLNHSWQTGNNFNHYVINTWKTHENYFHEFYKYFVQLKSKCPIFHAMRYIWGLGHISVKIYRLPFSKYQIQQNPKLQMHAML